MAPEKLPGVLLEVATAMPDVEFLVFGEPPAEDSAEAPVVAALALLSNVSMGGGFDGFESLPSGDCAAFLYTSDSDGMPNVVVEAMAAGLPVVAPAVGGIPELVDDSTGSLFLQPTDTGAYRDALEAVPADPEASEKRARAGLERIRERHSVESFERQLHAVNGYL